MTCFCKLNARRRMSILIDLSHSAFFCISMIKMMILYRFHRLFWDKCTRSSSKLHARFPCLMSHWPQVLKIQKHLRSQHFYSALKSVTTLICSIWIFHIKIFSLTN
jgi:hypothetical protein